MTQVTSNTGSGLAESDLSLTAAAVMLLLINTAVEAVRSGDKTMDAPRTHKRDLDEVL